MINMLKLDYVPNACCWVHRRGQALGILAVYVFFDPSRVGLLTHCAAQNVKRESSAYTMVGGMASRSKRSKSCIGSRYTS